MAEKTESAIEANPHNPADPTPAEIEEREHPPVPEPFPMPPNDPAMTAEEREELEKRHAAATKEWKAGVRRPDVGALPPSNPATASQREFTGTTTEDLEPDNKTAEAKTTKTSTTRTSKEKK